MLDNDLNKFNKKVQRVRQRCFPMKLNNRYSCSIVHKEEYYKFITKHFSKVFKNSTNSLHFDPNTISTARRVNMNLIYANYQTAHQDLIIFYDPSNNPIGWMMGETEDPTTYYMRNTGIFPVHQHKGIYSSFLPLFIKYIKQLGYERISSHHYGDNQNILIPKIRLGFIITGMENHENWGALIKMVKHLKSDRKKLFIKKYN